MRPILWLFFIVIAVFTGLFQDSMPYLAWWTCWITSAILYPLTIFGIIIDIPTDMPVKQQLFRPYFLAFTFFTGYVALSPIFYFLSLHGYEFFTRINDISPDNNTLVLVSRAQWYYLLGHLSFILGMRILKPDFSKPEFKLINIKLSNLFIYLFSIIQIVTVIAVFIPGLFQLVIKLNTLGSFLGVLFLGVSWQEKNKIKIFIGILIVAYSFVIAFLSGMKSAPLFIAIILGTFLVQKFPKTVFFIGILVFILWVGFIPFYNGIYRGLAWSQEVTPQEANAIALEETKEATSEELLEASWAMLYARLSEVGMFVKYLETVPASIPFYGTTIFEQSAMALVPRIIWPEKPDMEITIMKRVLDSGVVEEYSAVSAKPAFIADAYLSGGWIIIILMYIGLGMMNVFLSIKAESWFGGYLLGSGIMYSGLFQIVWLGNSFEFFTNAILWSFIVMYVIHLIFKWIGILQKNEL